ncbi:hypothetical protein OSTOST_13207, partial [Ostertagia ostertagi]
TYLCVESVNGSEYPCVIHDDAWCRIWFNQDDEYKRPKAVTKIAIITPVVNSSPKSTMLSLMYRSCLVDALTEDISNASLAGLYCDITTTHSGLVLEIAIITPVVNSSPKSTMLSLMYRSCL